MDIVEELELANYYTDSIFYEIELTAKYCKMLGIQVFEKYKIELPVEEFSVMEMLHYNPEICQRDLAKIILKDRANTGKLLNSLEKKGLVERRLAVKNNRPVRIATLTKLGIKKTEEISRIIKPHWEAARIKIENTDLKKMRELLKKLRNILKETVEIQI